jgi:hypothetical protein
MNSNVLVELDRFKPQKMMEEAAKLKRKYREERRPAA